MTTQALLLKDMPSIKGQAEGVRFSLKKRSVRDPNNMVNISSYNSDFLSGLFADVAKVSDVTDALSKPKRRADVISADESFTSEQMSSCVASKKSRISLKKCFSRVQSSAMNLSRLGCAVSPKGINEFFQLSNDSQDNDRPASSPLNHHKESSLQFQLSCVSDQPESSCCSSAPKSTLEDAVKIAFPNLPATVSDSSCHAGLTRANLVRQVSVPENPKKESFGWFVDLDDNQTVEVNTRLPDAVSSDSLAFRAPTAPKRMCDESDLEWAQAADTVDDVLGDFF